MKLKIFISGASGQLGGIIANSLCNKFNITIGSRNKKKLIKYKKNIKKVQVDYKSYISLKNSLKNIDIFVVINKVKKGILPIIRLPF